MDLRTRLDLLLEPLRRLAGRGIYPPSFAFLLTLPARRLILAPSTLANRLRLAPGDEVLELGAGPGYFSAEIARQIYPGRLTLVDIQSEMLALARRRLTRSAVENAAFVQADAADLPFPDDSFDLVVLVTVLGEIAEPERAAAKIGRVLRVGGRLSITEAAGDPDRLSGSSLENLLGPVGFVPKATTGGRLTRTFEFVRLGR